MFKEVCHVSNDLYLCFCMFQIKEGLLYRMPFCQKQFHALEQSARCLHKNRIGASPLQYGHNLPSRACRQSPISNILKQETSELLEPSLCLRAGHPISNYMTSETATPPQSSPIILGEFAVGGICPIDSSAYKECRLFSIQHKGIPWAQLLTEYTLGVQNICGKGEDCS